MQFLLANFNDFSTVTRSNSTKNIFFQLLGNFFQTYQEWWMYGITFHPADSLEIIDRVGGFSPFSIWKIYANSQIGSCPQGTMKSKKIFEFPPTSHKWIVHHADEVTSQPSSRIVLEWDWLLKRNLRWKWCGENHHGIERKKNKTTEKNKQSFRISFKSAGNLQDTKWAPITQHYTTTRASALHATLKKE